MKNINWQNLLGGFLLATFITAILFAIGGAVFLLFWNLFELNALVALTYQQCTGIVVLLSLFCTTTIPRR